MKKYLLLSLFVIFAISLYSQDDEYQKYLKSVQEEQNRFNQQSQQGISSLEQEYSDYISKANAEFAEFVSKEWALFEEFKMQELSMSLPKIKEAPVTQKSKLTEINSDEVSYKNTDMLPLVSDIKTVESSDGINYTPREDNYVVRKTLTDSGVKEITRQSEFSSFVKTDITNDSEVNINFYGKELKFNVDERLRTKNKGIKENEVAAYFVEMAKITNITSGLWKQVDNYVKEMGLNDWGYFCILRSLSEEIFTDIDNRVLFNFYMLRNEGNFKVKTARGKDSNKLTLLAALDNSKEVYTYTFFRFKEGNDENIKYYSIYGGGSSKESIYTYEYYEQDKGLNQIGLDFHNTLNMGVCDSKRELTFEKIDTRIELPFNSSHIAYLNDVPMTIFPIYFASPISIEAQQVFNDKLNELKDKYTPVQFIDIILNFVQTAFDYKTDEQQFGYEKYFYPEEVIAYPYSDCEDRSALFAWLVSTYTNAKVVGLQYEGHLATAVCFGEDAEIEGDMFSYAGRKYYVCDPTYINASIGMTMPQFKDKMPKIIKMKL